MKQVFKNLSLIATMIALMVISVSCEEDDDNDNMNNETMTQTIAEIASESDDLNILVEALTKAELVSNFTGTGNFTVFAPTDEAFNALFTALGVNGIDDLSAETLAPILLYHVLDSEVKSADITDGYVHTLSKFDENNAMDLLIEKDQMVYLNKNTKVSTADVDASNGVVHIIDKVLLPPTVVDIASYNDNFSTLVEAVVKAELVETLNGDGPFTVFAPTNDAFEALFTELGVTGIADLTKDDLTPILLYHVVSGNVTSGDLSAGTVTSLGGDFEVSLDNGVSINGVADVVATDIQGKNGVVHVIDNVLLPGVKEEDNEEQSNTIVDIALADENFSTLVAALQKAELVETLANLEANFTVFAPTNDAFADLLSALGASSLDDLSKEDLTPILLYHVLGSKVMSSEISDGYVSTLSPYMDDIYTSLLITTDGGVMLNGSANVTTADVEADNGVVHVIDEVILPPTVVDIAVDNSNFSILVEAVTKAELVETLNGEGPFTVFAPTNDAFEALFTTLDVSGIADLSKDDLTPILLYHVVSGNVRSTDLSSGSVTTLNGDFNVEVGSSVTINESVNVVATDVQGKNGVVHVIDAVLVPEEPTTVVDIALGDENFSSLVAALQKAELVEALQDLESEFTVFAPTNDAFADLLAALGASSLDDLSKEDLVPILLYHVLGSKVMSNEISAGYVSTLSEYSEGIYTSLLLSTDNGVMLNGSANVTTADVEADNGVVHVIDEVILPPSVVDIAIDNSNFSILVEAVTKAELVETLNGEGPFTVFAPTNDAFEALFDDLDVTGIADLTKEDLTPILQYHVVSGNVRSTDLSSGNVTTLNGDFTVAIGESVTINETTNVVATDVQGKNGVVHVIDTVLLPATK